MNDFGIIYLAEGKGIFGSEAGKNKKVGAGDMFLLFPGVWHDYAPLRKTGWVEHWVRFEGMYPNYLLENEFISPKDPIWHVGKNEKIDKLFNELLSIAETRPYLYNCLMTSIVHRIIVTARRCLHELSYKHNQQESQIRTAILLLETKWDERVNMKDLAASLNMSYRSFREKFKKVTSLSPHQYHLNIKINIAKKLLIEDRLEVKEVAYRLDFDDPYYFSRLFKNKTGVSPKHWNF